MEHRLGVDIGGTFTDVALDSGGRCFTSKVLTTPAAPQRGVLQAIEVVLEQARLPPSALTTIVHGTTLATNAIIERKGARTALITTEGFRDTIEIRHENRFEQYDLGIELPPPLVPRRLRFAVRERIDARGRVLIALDEPGVARAIDAIAHQGVEAVAIGLLHSYIEPKHERRIAAMLAERLPQVAVTLSCEVSPEMREYERFSTACANAFLQPLMASYLRQLREELTARGIGCPLYLMLSAGNLATLETAIRFPVRLIESGPAGGAIFASDIARAQGLDAVLAFDMGGTTAKMCLLDNGQPQSSRMFEVARMYRFKKGSGLPIRVPVIEMVEIGAGGGSIARLDRLKRLAVGPDSAGAEPGPASYRRGGAEPTVTDADLLLGRIDAAAFSGGRLKLDIELARAALGRALGEPLNIAPSLAAVAVSEMVDENMANAARVHAIESGKQTPGRTLIAFGGAGPLHAARLAEKLGIDHIVIPAGAGVGAALGLLAAPIAFELIRSRLSRLSQFDTREINLMYEQMRGEATRIINEATPATAVIEQRHAFMRYRGQGHEVQVALPVRHYAAEDGALLSRLFAEAYQRLYSRTIPGVDVEVVSWALSLRAVSERPAKPARHGAPYRPQSSELRSMFDFERGCDIDVPIYRRAELRSGAQITGPALITEEETSTVFGPAFEAIINGFGAIELRRSGQAQRS